MFLQAFTGITVVFIALLLLALSIYILGKTINRNTNKSQKNNSLDIEKEDDELIAVISAAISAYLDSDTLTPECPIKVNNFNRISSNTSIWHEESKKELVKGI